MEQAETYLELAACCPHCHEQNTVEWTDETVNGLEEWVCQNCDKGFTYCHPANNYGLSI